MLKLGMLLDLIPPEIFKSLERKSFTNNETIFSKGDTSEDVYILLKGAAKSVNFAPNGEMAYFKLRKAPDYFGYYGAIGNKPRTSHMISVGNTECAIIPRQQFMDLIFTNRPVGELVLNTIVDLLRAETDRLTNMITMPAKIRVASDILTQSLAEESMMLQMPNQTEWASRIGMKRETLSRALNELSKSGFIDISQNQIKILNSLKLEELINEN